MKTPDASPPPLPATAVPASAPGTDPLLSSVMLHQLFNQAPGYVAITRGPNHCLDYCNPAYQQLYAGRALLGQPIAATKSAAMRQSFVATMDEVYSTGKPFQASELLSPVEDPDTGHYHECYFDIIYQAFRENGQVAGVCIMAYDVTERVLLRQQQHRQLAHFEQFFEQAPAAVGMLRLPEFIIQLANPLMGKVLGLDLTRALGRPLLEAMPVLRGQGVRTRLNEVVATGQAFAAQGMPLFFERDGHTSLGYFNLVYQPLRDVHNQITHIAVVVNDVTEQVVNREALARTNQQLSQANTDLDATNQQLTRINADLDNFIYSASHDLKAPISNIEGLLVALREELARPPAEAELPELLDLMQGAVERFKRTIGHLTDIAKLQKAHDQPVADVPLAELIEAVRLDLRPEFAKTGGTLHVAVEKCPTIAFAEKNLRSIVYNLVSNALKYHDPARPPQVQIRCYTTAAHSVLEVQDNGLGLSAAQQQKLFGMFKRLHDHVEGSGIGLYMVKKITENAGGHIEVVSEPGVGSTFRVHFPRQD